MSAKQQKKEERKLRKAIQALSVAQPKHTPKETEAVADEVVLIEESAVEVEQSGADKPVDIASENDEEQESFVMDLTKNLISNTVQRFKEE